MRRVNCLAGAFLLFTLFAGVCSPRAQARQRADKSERYYAPIVIMPFQPGALRWTYDWQTAAELLSERISDNLSDNGVEVVAREAAINTAPIPVEQEARIGEERGALFALSGRLENITVKTNRLLGFFRTEVKVHITARLIDVEKRVVAPGIVFDVEGKKTKDGFQFSDQLNNLFNADPAGRSLYLDACKDASNKLVKKLLDMYPERPKPQPFFARWTEEMDGAGADEAAAQKDARLKMLRRVTDALTEAKSREANADLINKEIYGEWERFTEVETVRPGRYKVSVNLSTPIGDDRKNALALTTRLQQMRCLRQLKVVVSVPETHLAPTRLSDPAGETKLREELQTMGFFIVEFARADALQNQLADRLAGNQALDDATLTAIRQKYPADVLVWGEGISQRNEASRVGATAARCSARVEARAVWMADGHVLASSASHAEGEGGSEAIAAKQALTNAGARVAPRLAQNMFTTAYVLAQAGPDGKLVTPVEAGSLILIVTDCGSNDLSLQIEDALSKVAGIESVERAYKNRTVTFTLKGDAKTLKKLSGLLNRDENLKGFQLEVDADEKGTLTCHIKSSGGTKEP